MREDQLRGKEWRKNNAPSIKSKLLVKGIQESCSAPWLIHAAYFCILIWKGITQFLLGSWSALLRRRYPLMPVSLKQPQCTGSSPGMAGQPNVERWWVHLEHKPCSHLGAWKAFSRWKLPRLMQSRICAEAELRTTSSTDGNAPHKRAFPRTRVDFAAQNPVWRVVFWCFYFFF